MADEEYEDPAEEERGSNKLLMIIILVVGLGVGGGGAWYFLNQPAEAPVTEAEAAEEAKEEEEAKLKEAKFVLFEGLAVPVHNTRGKYIGNYKISIRVLTETDNNNVRVKNMKFELRHAFISRIAKGGLLMENSTNLDYDKTAKVLMDIANNLVGHNAILAVVIEDSHRVNN